jgi:hypothetical protein
MMRSWTRRPSPATIIAVLALVMATGGTSLAGSMISGSTLNNRSVTRQKIATGAIDSTLLAANAVTKDKIAKGSVSSSKLEAGAVTQAALAKGAVTSAALGAGAVAAANLAPATVSWKSLGAQLVAAPPVTLPGATFTDVPATGTASCPTGTVAISGGESLSDTTNAFVIQSFQAGQPGAQPTGWIATGATGGTTASAMTVYAICISAGA